MYEISTSITVRGTDSLQPISRNASLQKPRIYNLISLHFPPLLLLRTPLPRANPPLGPQSSAAHTEQVNQDMKPMPFPRPAPHMNLARFSPSQRQRRRQAPLPPLLSMLPPPSPQAASSLTAACLAAEQNRRKEAGGIRQAARQENCEFLIWLHGQSEGVSPEFPLRPTQPLLQIADHAMEREERAKSRPE